MAAIGYPQIHLSLRKKILISNEEDKYLGG
jgi:hypothetical protein